jgi:hypothetical protein
MFLKPARNIADLEDLCPGSDFSKSSNPDLAICDTNMLQIFAPNEVLK